MSVQELQVALTGKDVSASSALRALARAANQAAKSAGDDLEQMNRRVEDAAARTTRAVNKTSNSLTNEFGEKFASWAKSGLTGVLAGIAASVTSSVTSVVGDAGNAIMTELKSTVLDYNSTLEQATIGFTTMLGSGQKATGFLNQLQDFAQKTPFDAKGLIQLSQQMMGYGIATKNVIPYLTALGDASSAAGRTDALPNAVLAFEQMAARGRVDLADLNQLTAAGVPAIKILAGAYNTTGGAILKAVHSGHLMSNEALPALIKGIEQGTSKTAALGGMMAKQSETFQGALSNINDSLNRSLSTAFFPFFKVLEKGALGLTQFVQSKAFQKWATDTAAAVGDFTNKVGGAFKEIFADPAVQSGLSDLGTELKNAFTDVGPAISGFLPDFITFGKTVLPDILKSATDLASKLPQTIEFLGRLADGAAILGTAFAPVIGAISDFIGMLVNANLAVGRFVYDAAGGFASFINDSKTRLADFAQFLLEVGAGFVQNIVIGMAGQGNPIASFLSGLVGNAISVVQGQINGLRASINTVTSSSSSGELGDMKKAGAAVAASKQLASVARATTARVTVPSFSTPSLSKLGGGGSGSSGAKKKSLADIFADAADYGRWAAQGVQKGLLGSISEIRSAGEKMRKEVKEAFNAKYITKSTENDLFDSIQKTTNRLVSLAKQRIDVAKQIKTANKNLTDLRKDKTETAKNTKTSLEKAASITSYGSNGDLIQNMQRLVQDTGKFKTDLQQLSKKGVSQVMFKQLVDGFNDDPESALRAANNLLSNPTDLGEIMSLQKSLSSAGADLGSYAGNRLYDEDIAGAKRKVRNATSRDRVLSWEMQKTAHNGLNAVAKETHLHIHVNGSYAGTKTDLAKTITAAIREAEKTGAISKNWNR